MNTLDQPLGHLARSIPGATGLFHDYQLDFCCRGDRTLREAAAEKGLANLDVIAARLEEMQAVADGAVDWRLATSGELIDHILTRYHDEHRAQLPELIRLARRVEQVHAAHPDCPNGLADHLAAMRQALESHMMKEEQILFPMIGRGLFGPALGPIEVMRHEHIQHGDELERLARLTGELPDDACTTWRALHMGLLTLRTDLMEHIHLENNILFEGLNAVGGEASHG